MPTYEYECAKCNRVFEEEAPITAPPRQRCPQCRGKVVRLVSGGAGVVFRGSGFYVTDSRRPPASAKKPGAESAAGGAGAAAGAAPPAHDSKPQPSDKP